MKLHAHYYLVGLRWKARKEAKASAVVLKLQKLQGSDIRRAGKGKGPEAGRKRACGFADVGDLAFAAAPRRTSGDATCMRCVPKTAIQMSTLRRKEEESRFWFGSFLCSSPQLFTCN